MSKIRDEGLEALRDAASDEAKAVAFMEARRWPSGAACPRCGSVNVYPMLTRDGQRNPDARWRCKETPACGKMFTVRTGTVLEESRLPIRAWVYAFWRACASKKGISALQLSRELRVNYKTSLYLLNRVRAAMGDEAPVRIGGPGQTVEADETYHGGRVRNRNIDNPRGPHGKMPVFGAVDRTGKAVLRTLERVTAAGLAGAITQYVDARSRLMTDDSKAYWRVGRMFEGGHEVVKHKAREYARNDGDVTTNRIEGVFSLFKRGVYGTFHSISKKHLHRYLCEFEFRYNHRTATDAQRTDAAIRGADGKRLLKAQVSA